MSGGYDLLIFVRAKSLRGVASFVYEKLATIGGVTSTATHFFLKTYKQQGFIIDREAADGDRLIYSPLGGASILRAFRFHFRPII